MLVKRTLVVKFSIYFTGIDYVDFFSVNPLWRRVKLYVNLILIQDAIGVRLLSLELMFMYYLLRLAGKSQLYQDRSDDTLRV